MKKILLLFGLVCLLSPIFSLDNALLKLKEYYNSNGRFSHSILFEYYNNRLIQFEKRLKPDKSIDNYYLYKYSENRLVKREYYNVYNKGDSLGAFIYQKSGEELFGYEQYYYNDESGLLIKEESYSEKGKLLSSITYEYNQDKSLYRKIVNDENADGYNSIRKYTSVNNYLEGRLYRVDNFDSTNRLESYSHRLYEKVVNTKDYVLSEAIIFRFDKWNKVEDEDFIFSWMHHYIYDENSILIEQKSYDILTYIKRFNGSVKFIYY